MGRYKLLATMSDFPKQYDPKIHEKASQALWEENKIYQPNIDTQNSKQETFYIPIPPPNVTGNLHLGHALTLSIEDIMTRYHRLRGDVTLWVPGTDHAGIATQAQVEKRLEKNGTSRKAIGREAFLGECWKWIDEYGGNIQNQVKMMGASVNWDMERFTFDEKNNKLVEKIFVDLYEKWLIYRGEYMVNYSPVLESVISDIEVEHQEVSEYMYYINYFVSGSDKELLVATTRPETLLGDMALAVHPKDKRYKKLIGKSVILPIVNREIPIIGDESIDMEFGTGVVKVTPAHDPSDFEMGRRHGLRTDYRVIEKTGLMSTEAGVFAGLPAVGEARDNIVELLRSKWNLVKIEPYTHTVGFCCIDSVVRTS
jgi:valyl-tRNA synthetase